MKPLPEPIDQVQPLDRRDAVCLALMLAVGLWSLAPGLGHPHIHNWDESFHQAATRGVYDTFFTPHLYADPLYDAPLRQWWLTGIWLHKPTGAFWLGALMMHLVGVGPLALRLVSLLCALLTGACVFLLARPLAGRLAALAAAASFLTMPFGWIVVQGHFVGDATDATVTAFAALSVTALLYAIERQQLRLFALAGAAVGYAYLCKSFLALTPLGVVAVLWASGRVGFSRRFSGKHALVLLAVFVVVAVPWNVYGALKWHDVWLRAFQHTIGFLSPESGEDVGSGARPADAIFNEINQIVLEPVPTAVTLLAGLWLMISAARRRDFWSGGVALWLWSNWIVHSMANVKGHGHLWNVTPAWMVAAAMVLRDVLRSRALGGALLMGLLTPWWIEKLPSLAQLRLHLPEKLVQTRTMPGLAEGVLLVAVGALAFFVVERLLPSKRRPLLIVAGLAGAGLFLHLLLVQTVRQKDFREAERPWRLASYSKEAGEAVAPLLPEKAVIFLDTDLEAFSAFEHLAMILWSGKMTYFHTPEPALAHQHGLHPYLMSPGAEPFAPLPVPAQAWMRVYDLDVPAPPPPLPEGTLPLTTRSGQMSLLGVGVGPIDRTHGRWALYVHADGMPHRVTAVLHLADGTTQATALEPEAALRRRDRLAPLEWFVLPLVGPPREKVVGLSLDDGPTLPLP